MDAVADVVIPPGDVPARLYRPVAGPVPLVVYLHGGGWVIGSVATHDRACRAPGRGFRGGGAVD